MSDTPKPVDRRRFIVGAAALGVIGYAALSGGWLQRLLPARDFDFQEMDSPAGYRQHFGGATTGVSDPFIGLETQKPQGLLDAEQQVATGLCAALFSADAVAPDQVPLAYFFDYQCPICRRLTPRLRALQGINIRWHDLAGLGPASEVAARAAIAARNQGAYDAFHDRLMRSRFQANDGYIKSLAQSIGIDGARLLSDMESVEIAQQIWQSQALANLFGLPGTPGLVIGKTVVIGDIGDIDMRRVIALEAARSDACG